MAALVVLAPAAARANCNLIPASTKEFRSTLGTVDRTLAVPGSPIAVRVDLACNPTAQGFDPIAANNVVTVRFVPPGAESNPALATVVPIASDQITPANCGGVGSRCDTLLFFFPASSVLDAALPPIDGLGLAGAVEIRVESPSSALLAEIGPLFEPTLSCSDRQPEAVFGHLTAIPAPNSFGQLVGGSDTTIEATLDGNGNLLIPVDYSAVLTGGPGSAVFRILQASADLDAFSSAPGTAIEIPAARYLRSFNLAGRPIPPVLETTSDGRQIFGTVDARLSVVRVARTDPDAPGSPLYDLSDRLFDGRGPIVITNASASARESAPLATLSADAEGITFARSEGIEGDLNGDGDNFDRVPQVVDVQSGVGTSAGQAVTEVSLPGFARPILASGGGHIAFGASEARNGHATQNGDGDAMDSIFRVFNLFGAALATGNTTIDPAPVVNGKPLAISNDLVFFRTRESDAAARTIEVATPVVIPDPGVFRVSERPALSDNGRFLAFDSEAGPTLLPGAPAGNHIYLLDRQTDVYEQIDVAADSGSSSAALSADGRFVAFESSADNLAGGNPVGADVFVADRQTDAIACISCLAPPGSGTLPAISADGRLVAFYRGTDLFVVDRQLGVATQLTGPRGASQLSVSTLGGAPSISDDGRWVATYLSLSDGLTSFNGPGVFDRQTGDFAMADELGAQAVQLSGDGRWLAWATMTDLSTDDTNLEYDIYVSERSRLTRNGTDPNLFVAGAERVTVDTEGRNAAGDFRSPPLAISRDGRYVAYYYRELLVPGISGSGMYRYDRSTNTVEAVSVSPAGTPIGALGFGARIAISGDGRVAAYSAGTGERDIYVRDNSGAPSANAADADADDVVVQIFDVAAASYRPSARVPADVVAVAAGRAAVLSDEADDGGIDRNGDNDATDTVARIIDGASGAVTETGLAADAVAISEQVLCVAVNEVAQEQGSLNGDGDVDDDVLFVRDLASNQQTNTGLAVNASDLAAVGSRCVSTTAELFESGSPDLNGDNDLFDDVLRVYDAATGIPTTFPYATAELVAAGDLVAFRVCEADQGDSDLNIDGDFGTDCVMHVLTLSTSLVENTERAASPCTLPGCDPFFEPFRVGATTVSFLTEELSQSGVGAPAGTPLAVDCKATGGPGECDLSGDADNDDDMITVYNVRSGFAQLVPLLPVIQGSEQDVPPFPTEIGDSGVLYVQVLETQVGEDVNGDGQITDTPVLVLVGDIDGDGTLDDSLNRNDSCVEVANAGQLDADRDQLGDGACDPRPTATLPGDVLCDVDSNGRIDRVDTDVIFADRGMQARSSDPRDADGDGAISVLDVSLCRAQCTYASCREAAPAPGCGFGAELVLILGTIELARRRVGRRQIC